ncbi:MAG: 2-amino-4-hydroxy-6-hydroxymethyldihydropteridine diphosphokinase [Pseudomonadota bacterium]
MILVGLGSNRGDSAATLTRAMTALEAYAAGGFRRSSLWRTSPVDCPPESGEFCNAAVAFEARPTLSPEILLYRLKALERAFGRGPVLVRNAPRELDLDLLLFDDEQRDSDRFTLPHPRACERRFVLAPAAEVAPEARWPGTTKTVAELLAALRSDEQVERLCDAGVGGDP